VTLLLLFGGAAPADNETLTGGSGVVIAQTANLTLVKALAGQADIVTGQTSDLTTLIAIVALAGSATVQTSQSAALVLIFVFGGQAAIAVSANGTLFVIRPPTPPPAKISQKLLKRRSFIMPTPVLGPTGRPT
jgi:hypothetical protein